MGLLEPSTGHIYADSVDVKDPGNYRKWLEKYRLHPADDLHAGRYHPRKNVAFGVPEDKIDENRLWEVLKEAQLDEFIKTLPEGLETGIGERVSVSPADRGSVSVLPEHCTTILRC